MYIDLFPYTIPPFCIERVVEFHGGKKVERRLEVNSVAQQVCRDLRNKRVPLAKTSMQNTIRLPNSKLAVSITPTFAIQDNKFVITLSMTDSASSTENSSMFTQQSVEPIRSDDVNICSGLQAQACDERDLQCSASIAVGISPNCNTTLFCDLERRNSELSIQDI